jgi:hypothetical protein
MEGKLIPTDEALIFLEKCRVAKLKISTVDGFHVVGDNYMEDFDLMFTPREDDSAEKSIQDAHNFIKDNDTLGVVWDIWLEEPLGLTQ